MVHVNLVGLFLKHSTSKRRFAASYYEMKTKCGAKLIRHWLCYSTNLDKVYCQPCWHFGDYCGSFVTGYDDWQHLSTALKKHEESILHLSACKIQEMWSARGIVDDVIDASLHNEEMYWRQIIERIINVTLTLATQNLPFRGHREELNGENGENCGNFLAIIDLTFKI